MSASPALKVAFFALTQAAWFAAIVGNELFALAIIPFQMMTLHKSRLKKPTLAFLGLMSATGFAIDLLLQYLGLIVFKSSWLTSFPIWLFVLWISFSLSLPALLQLINRQWVLYAFFAFGGPLAYWGGAKLGAATVLNPIAYFSVQIVIWFMYSEILRRKYA